MSKVTPYVWQELGMEAESGKGTDKDRYILESEIEENYICNEDHDAEIEELKFQLRRLRDVHEGLGRDYTKLATDNVSAKHHRDVVEDWEKRMAATYALAPFVADERIAEAVRVLARVEDDE